MGYAAANGVVNTNTPLTELQIPVDATQAAQATQNFGITANLDADALLATFATMEPWAAANAKREVRTAAVIARTVDGSAAREAGL